MKFNNETNAERMLRLYIQDQLTKALEILEGIVRSDVTAS